MRIHDPIVVGHSWGGSVALCLAVTYPELVSGLCFVDGGLIEISKVPDHWHVIRNISIGTVVGANTLIWSIIMSDYIDHV